MDYGVTKTSNNDLQAMAAKAGAKITSAIQQASAKTGVGFSYLLQQANVESSFKCDAKAGSSSATGLFQFIDSTWLGMVRDHGEKYGLGDLADKISAKGKVSDPRVKSQILALRKDPEVASCMAAEYAAGNKEYLEKSVDGEIGSTELYMAHFMGPGGAAKFLDKMQQNPNALGVNAFPKEACANRGVFYGANGKPRTLNEIHAFFDKKFQAEGTVAEIAETSVKPANDIGANAVAALISPAFLGSSGGTKDFDVASADRGVASLGRASPGRASLMNAAQEMRMAKADTGNDHWSRLNTIASGKIAGLQNMISNPVDVMQLLEMASLRKDQDRHNA